MSFATFSSTMAIPTLSSVRTLSFLVGTEDLVLPPGEAGWHPRMSSRLGTFRLVQMPGSHEALFTKPISVAEKLIEAGRD